VRESVLVTVRIGEREENGEVRSLVSNTSLDDFRCGATFGVPEGGSFLLRQEEAAALRVKEGDTVRVLASQPRPKNAS
jgi:arginine N-succinyltransferase